MKNLFIAAALAATGSVAVQAEMSPTDVIDTLFDGMREGNGEKMTALVVDDARLDRLKPDGSLQQGDFTRWIEWAGKQTAGDADEQIFGVRVLQGSPELATVWAPFVINYKGEQVGCGVNQFTLGKTSGGWKILYGIDMPHKGDCDAYRASFAEN
jgi:hypothetical protein